MTRSAQRVDPRGERVIYSLARGRTCDFVTLVLLVFAGVATWLALLLMPDAMQREPGSVAVGRLSQATLFLVAWGPLFVWLWWIRRYVRPDPQDRSHLEERRWRSWLPLRGRRRR